MKYGLLVNPKAGKVSLEDKLKFSKIAKEVLGDCFCCGLETTSIEEFQAQAKEVSRKAETLVIMGGDGSVQKILDVLEDKTQIAFLPMGSFNALGYSIGMGDDFLINLSLIKTGKPHCLDTISVDGQQTLFSGIGFDAQVVVEREILKKKGISGKWAYRKSIIHLLCGNYTPFNAEIVIDGKSTNTQALDVLVSKISFYGPRLKMLPYAEIGDNLLHISIIHPPLQEFAFRLAKTQLLNNQVKHHLVGSYLVGKEMILSTDEKRAMHLGGELIEPRGQYHYQINPARLSIVF